MNTSSIGENGTSCRGIGENTNMCRGIGENVNLCRVAVTPAEPLGLTGADRDELAFLAVN